MSMMDMMVLDVANYIPINPAYIQETMENFEEKK